MEYIMLFMAVVTWVVSIIISGIYYLAKSNKLESQQVNTEEEAKKIERAKGRLNWFLLITLSVLFGGGFGVVGTCIVYPEKMKEKRCMAQTEGMMITLSVDGKESLSFPQIKYLVEGKVFTDVVELASRAVKNGEIVIVNYNPSRPKEYYIKNRDFKRSYEFGYFFLVVAAGILLVPVIIFILNKIILEDDVRDKIKIRFLIVGVFLMITSGWIFIAGWKMTVCVYAFVGLLGAFLRFKRKLG